MNDIVYLCLEMWQDSPFFQLGSKKGYLLPERAMYFADDGLLIISDLHIGKLEYFRTKGIPLPSGAMEPTLDRLHELLLKIKPDKLVFLGDLFHNKEDRQWKRFVTILQEGQMSRILLIAGNHDILDAEQYVEAGIHVSPGWIWEDIFFTHEPAQAWEGAKYNVSGHIHPAAVIKGKGRQSLRLPCFFQSGKRLIMPAFGHFTGSKTMEIEPGNQIFVIAGKRVVSI